MRIVFLSAVSLLSAAFVYATPAMAGCPRPTEAIPAIPDGRTADDATMKAARETVQAYVVKLESYQSCLKEQEKNATPDIPAQLRATWIAQGEAAIDLAQNLAADFTAALKTFKERGAPSQ